MKQGGISLQVLWHQFQLTRTCMYTYLMYGYGVDLTQLLPRSMGSARRLPGKLIQRGTCPMAMTLPSGHGRAAHTNT